MRSRGDLVGRAAVALLLVSALAGCGGGDPTSGGAASPTAASARTPGPDGATGGDDAPTATATATPTPDPSTPAAAEPTPGQPCEPGSHPDCSDATGTEGDPYRIIAGYADCLALHGPDAAYGLCTDLDGDGQAGYPDVG